MDFQQTRRGIGSVRILCQLAAERHVDTATLLQGTGIEAAQLNRNDVEIEGAQEIQLIRNLQAALPNHSGLGLDAGLRYHLSSYGIWGFALLTSPTVRAATEMAERFLELSYALVGFRLEEDARGARMVLDDSATPADICRFAIERDLAAWANATRELKPGGLAPQSVRLRLPRPAYAERFRTICGVMPTFQATANEIEIDPTTLDAPLPQANPATARLCLDQCQQLLAQRQYRDGVAGRVREQLFLMTGSLPNLEATAAALNLSTRTLRRQLQQEGTSFRLLASEVLESLAEEMLLTTDMKLDEIALRLGYSEPAAFIHAFKGWTGQKPGQFRREYGGG